MNPVDAFPVTAFAVLRLSLCVVVVGVALRMAKRSRWREDRLVVGFLGLLALHQACATMQDLGWLSSRWVSVDQLIGAFLAGLFLLALALLREPLWELHNIRARVRVSEMNMAPPAWTAEEIEAIEYLTRRRVRSTGEVAPAVVKEDRQTHGLPKAPAQGQAA
jgi:hypothetical protein